MRSNRLDLAFWRPPRREDALAEPAAETFLGYLEALEGVEPSLARVGLGNGDPADARRPELAELVEAIRSGGCVVSLYDGDDARAGRRMTYGGGWRTSPTDVRIGAKGELWRRREVVFRLLEHGVGYWEANEAGVYYVEHREHRFWLRWRRDGAETMLPNIPLASGWTSEQEWLGGRLWEWPEHEPARILDDRA